MDLYEDITSGDAHRIWSSSCAIRRLRNVVELADLASRLPEIRESTKGVELEGALRRNSSHLDFALRKLEFVRNASGCLCVLYEMDDQFNPIQEQTDGHVRVVDTIMAEGRFVDHYLCECAYCAQKFKVEEGEYHYPWWKWTQA